MKKYRVSTFIRINIIFALLLVPFTLWEVVNTRHNIQEVETEISDTVRTQMDYFISRFDSEMTRNNTEVSNFYLENDCIYVAANISQYMNYDMVAALNRIEGRKKSISRVSAYNSNVNIMIPSLEMVFQNINGATNLYMMSAADQQAYYLDKVYGRFYLEDNDIKVAYPYALGKKLFIMVVITMDRNAIANGLEHAIGYDSFYSLEFTDAGTYISNIPEGYNTADMMTNKVIDTKFGLEYTTYIDKASIADRYENIYMMISIFLGLYIFIVLTFFIYSNKSVKQPINKLIKGFERTEKGDFTNRIEEDGNNEFNYMFHAFNRMNDNLQSLFDKTTNQEILLQKSELKQLQTQINPHFLYNTFFLMHHLLKSEDYDRAELLSKELGTYYRYITRNAADSVRLYDENLHASTYASIQAMRFEGRMNIDYGELPEELKDIKVPRLIIQPILENCFNHGLENRPSDGLLRVTFRHDDGSLSIFVEDNGDGLTDEDIEVMNDNSLPALVQVLYYRTCNGKC